MHGPLYVAAAVAAFAVLTIAWLPTPLLASRADTVSTFLPEPMPDAPTAAPTAAISPMEIMLSSGRPLPVEQWAAF